MKVLVGLAGAAIAGVLMLSGCAPGDGGPSSGSPSSGPEATAPAASTPAGGATSGEVEVEGELIEITLADGKVTPNGEKREAKVGDTITLRITSDHDDEVHIHGIDIEIEVKAGETVTKVITLDQSGSFEVESHHPPKVIMILNVR